MVGSISVYVLMLVVSVESSGLLSMARSAVNSLLGPPAKPGSNEWSQPTQPTLEVNLHSPKRPFPQLAATVSQYDQRHDQLFESNINSLATVFATELTLFEPKIRKIIDSVLNIFDDQASVTAAHRELVQNKQSLSSFIYTGEFRVEVTPHQKSVPPEVAGSLSALEGYREVLNNGTTESYSKFLKEISINILNQTEKIITNELKPLLEIKNMALVQIQAVTESHERCLELRERFQHVQRVRQKSDSSKSSHESPEGKYSPSCDDLVGYKMVQSSIESTLKSASFLQTDLNTGMATIGRMIEELEMRRDVGEALFDQKALNMAVKLAFEEVNIVKRVLFEKVTKIFDTYKDVINLLIKKFKDPV